MKLYLSSESIPTPDDLAQLLGKPLKDTTVALIPNAQDYFAPRAWDFKAAQRIEEFGALGLRTTTVDLRGYSEGDTLKQELEKYDLIWVRGGNTFCLRYEMRRSGFDIIIKDLLDSGIAYGGDSAGAIVTGPSIAGIESADIPEFSPEVIQAGLNLIPQVVLPHTDNPEFAEAVQTVRALHHGKLEVIELKDSQAVIFSGPSHRVVEAST